MGDDEMTTVVMPSKSVFFSTIQWATFVSTFWVITNLLLKPFDLSIGELNHEQISAIALVLFNLFIFFQRLKPQSRLYWIKRVIDEVTEVVTDGQEKENQGRH
jgi:Na+/pantothenate symporter